MNKSWLSANPEWQNPALSGALAFLDCEVEQDIRAGTHAVLIGAAKGIGLNEYAQMHEPLMCFKGQYRRFQPSINYSQPRPLPILLDELV